MIITKRHIALIILLIITMICIIFGITMNKSEQTFNNSKFKIVLDAGHGGYMKCFKYRLRCSRFCVKRACLMDKLFYLINI